MEWLVDRFEKAKETGILCKDNIDGQCWKAWPRNKRVIAP